jgi:hypothetical protein
MEENEQVVNPEAPTTSEPEAVKQESQEPAEPEITTQEVETPATDAGQKSVSLDLDEFGVPYKNRAMEYKRKLEKLEQESKSYQQAQQVQQKPQYTIEQLEAFALEADDPAHKQWALGQAEKLREEKFSKMLNERFKETQSKQTAEQVKQQTFASVIQQNPDLIVKDANGQFLGWNDRSPLFQRVNYYMRDEGLASRPDALLWATKLARADLLEQAQPKINKTVEKANSDLRSLQKKTLLEGSGNQDNQRVSTDNAALERLKQTGSKEDATLALKEYFEAKGVFDESQEK